MKIVKLLFLLLLSGCTPEPSYGAFDTKNVSPIASALNGAYSTLGEDPWAILYNPAQIVRLKGAQVSFSYSRPTLKFSQLETNSFSGIYTRNCLNIAFGIGVNYLNTNVLYREVTGILSLGERLGEEEDVWDIALGSNLKLFSLRRGDSSKPDDPALTPKTILKLSGDVGLHLRVHKLYFGMSLNNILPANRGTLTKENVPMELRLGVGAEKIWNIHPKFWMSPILELTQRDLETSMMGGAKLHFLDHIQFNCGIDKKNVGMGCTMDVTRAPTEERDLRFSVSYQLPIQEAENFGSPLVGMTFLF